MDSYIFLKEISKVYGKKKNTTTALKNINLQINKGEFVTIMGPSGSGKTSLLNIIGLLHKPTSGEIHLNGKNVSKLRSSTYSKLRNKHIGYLFQRDFLLDEYTPIENTLIPTEYEKIVKDKNFFMNFSDRLFSKFGISDKKNRDLKELSGGEKQRVAISRALINRAEILIADEPTAALDSENSDKIMNYLIEINKEGKTIIMATHNKDLAVKSNRIVYLKDGEILWDKSKTPYEESS